MSGKEYSTKGKSGKDRPHYEFFGPYIGPIGMIVGLPIITFLYARYCGADGWPMKGLGIADITPALLCEEMRKSWNFEVFLIYVAYWLYQVILYFILPC
jgi:hypothetical protein